MGPTLARMAARARDSTPGDRRLALVIARGRARAERRGRRDDSLRPARPRDAVARLPDAPNVIFMAGQKFGTDGRPALTWAMNTHRPRALRRSRYRGSRIVAFSTGNVYPLTPRRRAAARARTDPLGTGRRIRGIVSRPRARLRALLRRRIMARASRSSGSTTPIDLRYGVLVDVALRVVARRADRSLAMGYVNVIWQGDANALALECLAHASIAAVRRQRHRARDALGARARARFGARSARAVLRR